MDTSFLTNEAFLNFIAYLLFGSGGIATLYRFVKNYFEDKRDKRKRDGMLYYIDEYADLQGLMQSIREDFNFSHAFLFKAHDHGKRPSLENPFYMSFINGAGPRAQFLPEGAMKIAAFKEEQTTGADVSCIDVIATNRKRINEININKIEDDSALANYFKSHKIGKVFCYYIATVNSTLYFAVVADENNINPSKTDLDNLKCRLDFIKKLFNFKFRGKDDETDDGEEMESMGRRK